MREAWSLDCSTLGEFTLSPGLGNNLGSQALVMWTNETTAHVTA